MKLQRFAEFFRISAVNHADALHSVKFFLTRCKVFCQFLQKFPAQIPGIPFAADLVKQKWIPEQSPGSGHSVTPGFPPVKISVFRMEDVSIGKEGDPFPDPARLLQTAQCGFFGHGLIAFCNGSVMKNDPVGIAFPDRVKQLSGLFLPFKGGPEFDTDSHVRNSFAESLQKGTDLIVSFQQGSAGSAGKHRGAGTAAIEVE